VLTLAEAEPSSKQQLTHIEALREEINASDPDQRFIARSRVNASLKRLIDKILVGPEGNFLIYGYESKVWLLFDKQGNEIGNFQQLPQSGRSGLQISDASNSELKAAQAEFLALFDPI